MKQTITPEQLNELSDKGKEKLHHWSYNKGISKFTQSGPEIPLLSIGQMIEFLDKKLNHIIYRTGVWYDNDGTERAFYRVITENYPDGYADEELSDALFEAVKEVLNEKELENKKTRN